MIFILWHRTKVFRGLKLPYLLSELFSMNRSSNGVSQDKENIIMASLDITNFDQAFSSDCSAENMNNPLCIYWCYIYVSVLSATTDMIVPNFCSNLTVSVENKVTQKDEIGIILGSLAFVLMIVLAMIFIWRYIRKNFQTTPEEPPDTSEAPVLRAIRFRNPPGRLERLKNYCRNCFTNT